ncbi:hypothetical protein [Sinomicrobium soli]|uniref:hypothetical protein n=1 Tax=Sinomicrobium sp. N-1-3-6 TaxID=2219864 RepID=UPI000DCB3377|nr:hypothetical protein [Sinomicrobium sp. N-1-3-6]RAV29517.1 hypothetical protein DN748_08465 [Sinomicrobium sp. N-1-3-6]
MKNVKLIFGLLLIAVFITSCSVHRVHTNANGKIPPGQMKKVTGEKSAKNHAPGQQKKQPNYR